MGSAVSSWQPPDDNLMLLTKDEVINIVGEEYFDEDKYNEIADDNKISVAQLKACLYEYATNYISNNPNALEDHNPSSNDQESTSLYVICDILLTFLF
jgi:hypothetical protein